MGSRYRPLEWLIQLTSIFFRVPPNLSVKVPVEQQRCNAVICCTGKSDYNPNGERTNTKLHPARSLQSDVKSASRNKTCGASRPKSLNILYVIQDQISSVTLIFTGFRSHLKNARSNRQCALLGTYVRATYL